MNNKLKKETDIFLNHIKDYYLYDHGIEYEYKNIEENFITIIFKDTASDDNLYEISFYFEDEHFCYTDYGDRSIPLDVDDYDSIINFFIELLSKHKIDDELLENE